MSKRTHDEITSPTDSSPAFITKSEEVVFDVSKNVGLSTGKRCQVQWEIHIGDDQTKTKWWSATLLPHDGRTHILHDDSHDEKDRNDKVTVPLLQLQYDAFPEEGFPEQSVEDVCFLTDHSLFNVSSETRSYWRIDGDTWEPSSDSNEKELFNSDSGESPNSLQVDEIVLPGSSPEDALRKVLSKLSTFSSLFIFEITITSSNYVFNQLLDTVLESALISNGTSYKNMTASQQRIVAENIEKTKEKLVQKLLEQCNSEKDFKHDDSFSGLITEEHVKRCLGEL